ncbi:hypothetical protein D3C85_1421870 [compost metagenome]
MFKNLMTLYLNGFPSALNLAKGIIQMASEKSSHTKYCTYLLWSAKFEVSLFTNHLVMGSVNTNPVIKNKVAIKATTKKELL